jgi:hypothetical protein
VATDKVTRIIGACASILTAIHLFVSKLPNLESHFTGVPSLDVILVVNNYTSPRYHFESVGRGYVRKNGAGSYGAGRGDRIDGSAAIAARAQLPNGCERVVTTMEVVDEGRGGKYR